LVRVEEIPLQSPRLKLFVNCPWHIHKGDEYWTPPLKGDLLGNRFFGLTGLLTKKHPYHLHADVTHYLAFRDGRPVGRISAAVNRRFNEYYKTRIGFFGFFNVINDYSVAEILLDQARVWVASKGMDTLRGPGEYSAATHERQGVLIDGFETPPTIETTYNPPYYSDFLDRYGFQKAKDYHAYQLRVQVPTPTRLISLVEQVKKRRDINTRPISLESLSSEVRLLARIYNDSWQHNWGFLPITDEEAIALAHSLRSIADPGLIRFAFVNNKPAGVIGAIPDAYCALRPRWHWYGDSDFMRVLKLLLTKPHIPSIRLMFFGIRPGFRNLGIDAVLFNEVKEYAMLKSYETCEASQLLEDNHLIISPTEFMGAERYKTWRIYELPLE
jgi:GNAT superfamily N-acetyltransferase